MFTINKVLMYSVKLLTKQSLFVEHNSIFRQTVYKLVEPTDIFGMSCNVMSLNVSRPVCFEQGIGCCLFLACTINSLFYFWYHKEAFQYFGLFICGFNIYRVFLQGDTSKCDVIMKIDLKSSRERPVYLFVVISNLW